MTRPTGEPQAGNSSWGLLASAAAFLFVLGLDLAYLGLHLPRYGQVDGYYWGMQDFRDAVYIPCVALRDGVNPYDVAPYMAHFEGRVGNIFPLYSPLLLALFFPLSFVPLAAAIWIYHFINLALLLVCCGLTLRWCGWKCNPTTLLTLGAIVLASEPARTNLIWGQLSWPLALGTYLALTFARQRPAFAGAAIGLASLKPTYLVTVVWFLLFRGDLKAVAYGIGFTVLGALVGLALMATCGIDVLEIPRVAFSNQDALLSDPGNEPATTVARVDIPVVLGKVFGVGGRSWLNAVAAVAILLISGWLVARETRREENRAPDSVATLLICLASLLSIYHHAYELVLLTLPGVALITGRHPSWSRLAPWMLACLRGGMIVVAINVLWTGPGVRIAKTIAAFWPPLQSLATDQLWQLVTSVNSVTITLMWVVVVVGCLWPRTAAQAGRVSATRGELTV
ncbi:MAG: glycosyltransferase family 87 protein [Pirellulaceae bacterium]|nr:glycosyltransferase family 87 protein [Pirellulaceae bacterium]